MHYLVGKLCNHPGGLCNHSGGLCTHPGGLCNDPGGLCNHLAPPSSLPSPPLSSPSSLPYFCPSLDAIDPNAHPAFQASHDLKDVITRALRRKSVGDEEEVDGRRVPGMRKTLSIKLSLMTPVKPMLVSDRMQYPFSQYSESSVIRTSVIRTLII